MVGVCAAAAASAFNFEPLMVSQMIRETSCEIVSFHLVFFVYLVAVLVLSAVICWPLLTSVAQNEITSDRL